MALFEKCKKKKKKKKTTKNVKKFPTMQRFYCTPSSGCIASSESKQCDTLIAYLKDFYENVILEKNKNNSR